jgi:TonB family protein
LPPTATNTDASRPQEPSVDLSRPPAAVPDANVVVLAEDVVLLELLKRALEGRQRVWRAEDPLQAADLLIATHSGVLFIDAAVATHDTPALVDRLHEQFPDFPIVVAGRRDDELALGTRISSGTVFRFLHKPVSADRVRNFIDAAARRGEQTVAATPSSGDSATVANPLDSSLSIRLPRIPFNAAFAGRALRVTAAAAGAALVGWALILMAKHRPWEQIAQPVAMARAPAGTAPPAPTAAGNEEGTIARLLGAAGIALSQDHLTEPEGQNAADLYRLVLRADPGNVQARVGLARTAERLLLRVESLLLGEDLQGAAGALDAARSADPSNPRLEFFSAQLLHERDRLQRAGAAALPRAGDDARAQRERIAVLLKLADERMRQGALAGGADSAEALVIEARTLRPEDPGVQQALNALSGRMLLASNDALRDGDTAAASGWLDRAAALGVDGQSVERLRAAIDSRQRATIEEDRSRLLALANQRIAQGRLLSPPADSARHYADLLRAADPGYAGLAETEALLAARLLEQAGRMTRDGRFPEAEALLAAAGSGAGDPGLVAARDALAAARERADAAREILPEGAMTRIAGQPAAYPARALERGIQGWVEVGFTVATDGSTRDATVLAAEPAGVFEQAVLEAIAGWRYEPRIVAGSPLDQRVRTRVRFELDGR